jgi:hypothetical protein
MPNITKPTGLSNIWANGGTKIDPGATKVNIGWVVQLPPYEYQNWVDNRQDRAIAHINQHGVAEWDATTEYQGLLSYTQGSDGVIYKCLQTNTNKDPSNTLNNLFWAVAFEQYGSVAVVSTTLAAHITNYQTLAGIGNLSAARANLSVYSKVESDTRFAGLNGSPSQVFSIAVATQPEHAVRLGQVAGLLTQATESTLGVVKLATTGSTEAGVDDLTAITPLKGNAVYVKKSGNLAGLANYATARSNLGLGTAAVQNVELFAQVANNLSDLASPSAARSNLGLTSTATQPENYFLRASQNLSDLANVSLSRSNLGLTTTATTPLSSIMLKADNLAGLADVAQARTNLGLGSAATQATNTFLQRANNLSDLSNVQAARNSLDVYSRAEVNTLAIGVGQTWQDVRGIRTPGVTYTNNTSGPIMVIMQFYGLNSTYIFYLNGRSITYSHSGAVTGVTGAFSCIIPVGDTYAFNAIPQVLMELR